MNAKAPDVNDEGAGISYVKNTLRQLNEEFYNSYDTEYWITRAGILRQLILRSDIRREIINQLELADNDETIVNRLKVDLHFLTYHSVEALFALIFAECILNAHGCG